MSYEEQEALEHEGAPARPPDGVEARARGELFEWFERSRSRVFFSRQLEVAFEQKYFHWVTNRALRDLIASGVIVGDKRRLASGSEITLLWHRSFRYPKRTAQSVLDLVDEYADPNIGGALGLHGESLVLEGFAKHRFVMLGRHTREHESRAWVASAHNLDFIFARDGVSYGVEVKNTLGYMEDREFKTKIEICRDLGVVPVFAVRMIPTTWVHQVNQAGGFALIMKYQLYPWTHRSLAGRVATELGLPVDAPRALADGTMARFVRWHEARLGGGGL